MQGWFNIKNAARYMDIGERTLRELVKLGYLSCSKPHVGPTLIRKEWMDEYLEGCKDGVNIQAQVDKIVREVVK